ncbi:hypothetical protein, conserved [Eimeria praecox]|uniref:Uncharacterized protein n=1 Tax=Eimeria praecox TaxID=51316 RepID=U6H4B4_9EIME|nr:hypothetical protein, conserved [Eimeria praecox]
MDTQTTLPDGALTERLYKLICERSFHGSVELIMDLVQRLSNPVDHKRCYALLPILAYCLYMAEDFEAAGEVYNLLVEAFPAVEEYQLYATYCSIQCSMRGEQPGVTATLMHNLETAGISPLSRFKRAPTTTPDRLDCVTLHNQALTLAASDPPECITMLTRLLDERSVHKTTVTNLLILYCKYGHFEAAEKLMASFGDACFGELNKYEAEFLRSCMIVHSAPFEAQERLEALEKQMRQQLCDLRGHATAEFPGASIACLAYGGVRATQVIMALAESYNAEGKISKAEKKYDKCLSFYEDAVRTDVCRQALHGWEVVVLANALVANILLGHLHEAQQILNFLNTSEQLEVRADSTPPEWNDSIPHCSVAKLIVGTLYCAEKAYDYGIRTVLEGLDPIERALNVDTWGYCKACIGSLLTDAALGNFILDFQLKRNIAAALLRIERKARNFPCTEGKYAFTSEARALRKLLSFFP